MIGLSQLSPMCRHKWEASRCRGGLRAEPGRVKLALGASTHAPHPSPWPGGLGRGLRRLVVLFAAMGLAWGPLRPASGAPQDFSGVSSNVVSTKEPAVLGKPSFWKARSALKAGRTAEARLHYAALLKSGRSGRKRAEALYWVGMLGMAPDADSQDMAEARSALAELGRSYPTWERTREAGIVLALLQRSSEEHASLEAQRASASRGLELCLGEQDDSGLRAEAAQRESEALKSALETCRAEELSLREDVRRKDEILKGKDEALKKIKEVLVDWKAPR